MKKLFLFFAAILPLSVFAQTTPPPVREISLSDLTPFIRKLAESADEAGAARDMVSTLDASKMLRLGTRRNMLDGQDVYYEQYSIVADIAVSSDGKSLQSVWSEGKARKTGEAYVTREWTGKDSFTESIEFADEGFFRIYGATAAVQSADGAEEKDRAGSANLQIAYTPIQVHFKELKQLSEVREGSSGEVELLLTDTQDLYALDGYTVSVSSSDTGVLTVASEKAVTGSDGRAKITVCGVKKGTATVKVLISLHEDKSNSHVYAEREIEIEVKGPERWEYTLHVRDASFEPAHEYTLRGSFSVVSSTGEDGLLHYQLVDVSDADKSNGGKLPVKGDFIDGLDRSNGVGLAFDPEGTIEMAQSSPLKTMKGAMKLIGQGLKYAMTGQAETTDSKNVLTAFMCLLEEGSWSFRSTMSELEAIGRGAEASSRTGTQDARQAQISYLKTHHCLAIPDLTQMLHMQFGNVVKDGKKYESQGESAFNISGSITLHQLEDN